MTAKQQNLWFIMEKEEEEPAMTWRYIANDDCLGGTYQYINDEGRIVAEVIGQENTALGWSAGINGKCFISEPLGRYITVDAAKSAVIRALHNRAVEGK